MIPRKNSRRICPVCLQVVRPTAERNVAQHRDSIGRDKCPMSGEPYELCDTWRPQARAERRRRIREAAS